MTEQNMAPEAFLKPGERLDDLQFNGLKLIQRPDAFRFGTDSVLLADFAAPPAHAADPAPAWNPDEMVKKM